MKLLEYEAKRLLSAHGAPIPAGQLITSTDRFRELPLPLVIKVQIPKGGRGKAGGVKFARTKTEFDTAVKLLLSKPILGYQAKTLLAEEALSARKEFYVSVTVDRTHRGLVLLAHKKGGVNIESAVKHSETLKIPLAGKPDKKITAELFDYFGLSDNLRQPLHELCVDLWETCVNEDALLVEVNPLILTEKDGLICADAKIELDDAAFFRHRDRGFEHTPASTQFVVLNKQGAVGSMANGAGLAMATIDAIKSTGAEPANFLDVGGGTNTAGMVAAFNDINDLPNVKAIVVNIFGGITRCNEVADAIVQAQKTVADMPPLFIRLTGTNEEEGREILRGAGVPILPDLKACVEAAAKEVNNV